MDNKLKFQQLECYKLATDEQKEKLNKEQYFDLDKLPGNQLQTEFVEYIYYRGTQVSILTIKRRVVDSKEHTHCGLVNSNWR